MTLKLLILGGTAFLGPELIEAALARNSGDGAGGGDAVTVTTFNRGKTNPDLFAKRGWDQRGWKIEELRGDRDPAKGDGLKALEALVKKGRTWDAVIDTSAYYPRVVDASAQLLRDAVRQYIFISTVSVYADNGRGPTEDSAVGTIADPSIEAVTGESYGPLKALCEQAATKVFGDRATNIRPGLIVGPGDPTDRFTYWPVRLDRGGATLLPVSPDPWKSLVQWIDVRDLAEWTIRLAEHGHGGTYNALGPEGPMSFQEFVFGCRAATASPVTFVPIEESFLTAQSVGPWMEVPMWVPQVPDMAGFGRASNAKAIAVGLTFRPLAVTAADTIRWHRDTRPADYDFGAPDARGRRNGGLTREKEALVIAAWNERNAKEAAPATTPAG